MPAHVTRVRGDLAEPIWHRVRLREAANAGPWGASAAASAGAAQEGSRCSKLNAVQRTYHGCKKKLAHMEAGLDTQRSLRQNQVALVGYVPGNLRLVAGSEGTGGEQIVCYAGHPRYAPCAEGVPRVLIDTVKHIRNWGGA
jgi:hypothetical protein